MVSESLNTGEKMSYTRFVALLLTVGLITMPACGVSLKKNWGRSFEEQRVGQLLDPSAGKNTKPVDGMNGRAAEGAVQQYEGSFGGGSQRGGGSESLFDALNQPVMH